MSLLFQLKLYRSTTCFLLHTPQGGKLPLLLTPLTYIHVGNQGPCSRAQPINSPSMAIVALDSSTLSPDSFYLLHPCSRVLTPLTYFHVGNRSPCRHDTWTSCPSSMVIAALVSAVHTSVVCSCTTDIHYVRVNKKRP